MSLLNKFKKQISHIMHNTSHLMVLSTKIVEELLDLGVDLIGKFPTQNSSNSKEKKYFIRRLDRGFRAKNKIKGSLNHYKTSTSLPKNNWLVGDVLVDASFRVFNDDSKKAGVGVFFKPLGIGVSIPIRADSSAEAESIGVWLALALSKRLQIRPTVICDCSSVVEVVGASKDVMGRWRRNKPSRRPLTAIGITQKAREEKEILGASVIWLERSNTKIPHNLAYLAGRGLAVCLFGVNNRVFDELDQLNAPNKILSKLQERFAAEWIIELSLPLFGLAWQDWNTERFLDEIAKVVIEKNPALTKSA